jgi:phosphohistidine phosphatase
MDIYVIRHAQALDRSEPIDDAHRPLTVRGRKEARRLGKLLRHEEVSLDALVTSPLVRAVETASQVVAGLEFDGPLEVAAELAPGRDPLDVVREVLMPRADLDAVAIVGHQPQLGELLGLLLRTAVPDLAKASAVRVRWFGPEEAARFKWVLHASGDRPQRDMGDIAHAG